MTVGVLFVMCMGAGVFFNREQTLAREYIIKLNRMPLNFNNIEELLVRNLDNAGQRPEAIGEIKALHQALQTQHAANRDQMNAGSVPFSARSLHAEFERYHQFQGEALQKYGQIIAILETGTLTRQQKKEKGMAILVEIEARENAHVYELQRLQDDLASSNGITLTGPRAPKPAGK